MTTTTTLSIPAGGQAGPFDLYSNFNNYATAFEVNKSAQDMTAGFTSSNVPDGTTIIRVQSTNICTNYIDITVTTEQTIGTQTFLNKNLDVTTYRDGTEIPEVQNAEEWAALTTGAWCHYDNDPANEPIYGKLYNWYAAIGIATPESNPPTPQEIANRKNIAPLGYHVPVNTEWQTLNTYLSGINEFNTGAVLKSIGTIPTGGLWKYDDDMDIPNLDSYNFTAVPAGSRSSNYGTSYFNSKTEWALFHSLTEDINEITDVRDFRLYYNVSIAVFGYQSKSNGKSIRLIKD